MSRSALPFALLLLLVVGLHADEDLPLEARVNTAIDRGAQNLIGRQAEDGSWNKEDKVHPLGRTALCTFALLHAGLTKDDEPIRKATVFLNISDRYG